MGDSDLRSSNHDIPANRTHAAIMTPVSLQANSTSCKFRLIGKIHAAIVRATTGSPPPRALARKLCAAQAELLFDEVAGEPPAPAVDLETDDAVEPALRRGALRARPR